MKFSKRKIKEAKSISQNVQQWNDEQNTKHKHLTNKNIKLKQNKPHYCKKKEQHVKILYVCISSFSYTYQRKAKQKIETKIITIS